ncbi:MAG: YjbQ family protein [Chloroflexi bacterium]|jgi:secondary thiamine-phosphate synthase enzyme|nr:MAG: YjbQ family protein [Chloroflexota bacterium]
MVINTRIHVQTKGDCELLDITHQVAQKIEESDIKDGTVTVFVTGSTAGVTTIEYERGVLSDFQSMWDRAVPRDIPYRHDAAWGDGNGHAHVRASLLGPSLVVPFVNSRMMLGTWQQIVLADFDNRTRSRDIVLQIMGE